MSPTSLWMAWAVLLAALAAPADPIRDIRDLHQDHRLYLEETSADALLLSPEDQLRRDLRYNTRFFSPWHRGAPRYARDDVEEEFREASRVAGYAENRRPHDPDWMRQVRANALLDDYPNAGRRAITLVHTHMRTIPTVRPYFRSCGPGACDYPFDRFQQTLVPANTPLWISHVSADGAWLLVETGFTYGWIPAREAAPVDEAFVRRWETGRYATVLRDETPLRDAEGRFLFKASLGTMFPETGRGENGYRILTAVADENGRAVSREALLPEGAAAPKPLPLTRRNLARVANALAGQPYGWGGMYENRDCSAMIRDLFAPFGIWLPRNSKDQARAGGRWVDLSALKPADKEWAIRRDGIPYLTLLYLRGHIMLYMGEHDGALLVFHNFWSVRTKGAKRSRGKQIVGQAAVTTLRPGGELQKGGKGGYLRGLLGMTFLAGPGTPPEDERP